MTNIIEPCCAERQLGQLLREAHGQAALFQTNGDVTAKLFIKDTMLLSGDRPRTLTIAASEMPQEAMRLVERYAQLGYIAHLRLMLPSDVSPQPSDISHQTSDSAERQALINRLDRSDALMEQVLYYLQNPVAPEIAMYDTGGKKGLRSKMKEADKFMARYGG